MNRIKAINQERGMHVMGREEKASFSIAHAEAAGERQSYEDSWPISLKTAVYGELLVCEDSS